jgi:predicted permease
MKIGADIGGTKTLLEARAGAFTLLRLRYENDAFPDFDTLLAHFLSELRTHHRAPVTATCLALALAGPATAAQPNPPGPGVAWMALVVSVCVPLCNVAAVWPLARHGGQGYLRELSRNPLIIATASGLVANLLGFRMPVWLEPAVGRIGAASLALGLMAAGAGMQLAALARAKLLGLSLIGIKHLLLPLIAFGLARALKLEPTQALVLLAFSALPTASSAYVLAARMGYDGAMVAALVTTSTVMGLLSLPLAMHLATHLATNLAGR